MLARLARADKLLLGAYLPAYAVALILHAHEVSRSGLAQLPVFVRPVAGDYPRVAGYPIETDSSGSGLEPGDRLVRLGERDLTGVGYVGFQAIGLAHTRPGHPAPLVFERAGELHRIAIEARPHRDPWLRLPLLLLIPAVCVLLLLRAPGSSGARRLFMGALTYAVMQAEFYGGPEWKTGLAAVTLNLAAPVAIVTMLHWARHFPDEMPETARVWNGWPWLAMLVYVPVIRGSYFFGWPISGDWIGRISLGYHGAMLMLGGSILVWNYVHAWAPGRRRLRWIVLFTLLGGLPLLAGLSAPLFLSDAEGFTRVYAIGSLPMLFWVTGIVFAVVREHAFDVDRLLGATAAWSLAAGAGVVMLAVLVPAAATEVAGSVGVDPLGVRLAFAVLLGALAVPLVARLRPRIDQLLFPGREALREGTERLLEELLHCRSDDELLGLAGERCAGLLDARGFAVVRADADGFSCLRSERLAVPARLPALLEPPRLAPNNAPPELAAHGVALVLPLRLGGRLGTLLCFGAKGSGDIYTRTDTDALAAVAARIEATHERLAKEQLHRESRAKTNLIAAASHDLRQPLHAVGLLADALAGRLSDPKTRELVERIGASTQELDGMLTSLLDRSKLDAGAVRPERERVELGALFAQLERDFAGPAQAKGLRLRIAPTRLAASSDRLLLLRILRNLLSNAIRYTETGAVWMGARRRGSEVAIEVRDSGPGVAEDAQREIFEAFHQLPGAKNGGLGLGLSIVDGLARLLGHALELRSAPGHGSKFTVRAPLAPGRGHTAPELVLPASRTPLAARRVLVVDDDEAVRHATRELLASWRCEVREAACAAEALAAVESFRPDLVLADYRLGAGPTGAELIERLRADRGLDPLAVIVTGDSSGASHEALRAAGITVLTKPVPPARLRALLEAAKRER